MNPQPPYPYAVPPPSVPLPGLPTILPSGLALRPPPAAIMPGTMYPRPPLLMQPTGGRPLVLPKPTGAPVVVAPAPRLAPPGVMPPKSTTLYVGKISPDVDDAVVKSLLEACGPLRSWKRVQDPETQKPRPFGFCEYEEAEGVVNALQLLNSLDLDGQELLLKPNSATQKYIDELARRKEADEAKAAERAAAPSEGVVEMDADGVKAAGPAAGAEEGEDTEASRENAMLERIMAIVSEQAARSAAAAGRGRGVAAAADSFLSSLREEGGGGSRERRGDHHRRAGDPNAEERAARQLEAEFAREKDRERREAEKRRADLERAYRESEKEWERHEREVRVQAEAEHEGMRAAAKERARELRADLEAPDSDTEVEPWARKPIAASQRSEKRRRRTERESAQDAADREAEEVAAAKRQRTDGGERFRENGLVHSTEGASKGHPEVDVNDPIYQAMIAAAKEQPKQLPAVQLPPPPALPAAQVEAERARQQAAAELQQQIPRRTPPYSRPSPAHDSSQDTSQQLHSGSMRSKPLLSVFGGDEEEDKPKRKLIPLTWTEEERRAVQPEGQQEQAQAQPHAQQQQPEAQPGKAVDSKTAIKELIKSIPIETEAVFAYPIRWDAYDANSATLAPKLSAWVKKKTAELLGEEELSMVEFVMNMVKEHTQPAKMQGVLQGVMDDETQPFVLKLFRMIILETEKRARGITE